MSTYYKPVEFDPSNARLVKTCEAFNKQLDESPEKMLQTMKGEQNEWTDKFKQVTDVYNSGIKDELNKYKENLDKEESDDKKEEL